MQKQTRARVEGMELEWNAGMCLELGMAFMDRDGERAGCPPGVQRGDMEPRLSNGHPVLLTLLGWKVW